MKTTELPRLTRLNVAGAALIVLISCTPGWGEETNSRTVSGETARDRNDTIRSNETRVNTTGRDISSTDMTKLSRGDRRFIEKAAAHAQAEIRLAKLAAERATDPRIRSFAQQIATEHEKANAELHALAGKKGVSLLPDDHGERHFRGLSEKTGTEFDAKFLAHLNDEHKEDLDLFEKAARKSDDADVAAYASRLMPMLQEHRTRGVELQKAIKP